MDDVLANSRRAGAVRDGWNCSRGATAERRSSTANILVRNGVPNSDGSDKLKDMTIYRRGKIAFKEVPCWR